MSTAQRSARPHRAEPAAGSRSGPAPRAARLLAPGLVAATALAYAEAPRLGFVGLDDPGYVTANPVVAGGLSLDGLRYALTSFELGNWHPVTWLSHMAVVELAGVAPGPHHVANVLLHALNALLLLGVLRRTTGAPLPSALVAALFALHPLHVESVAWVAERKDVLSTTFWLLATGAYASWVRRPRRSAWAALLVAFALGLASKPMLVTLPVTLLLLDVWPLRRLRAAPPGAPDDEPPRARGLAALVREKAELFALAAAGAGVALVAQADAGAVHGVEAHPLGTRLANAVVATATYLRQTLWPADLAVFYPFPGAFAPLAVAGSAGLLLALTAGALAAERRAPSVTVGWLWFLVTLAPVIGLVQVGGQAHADRYTYVPHVGLFTALVFGAAELLRARPRARWAAAAVATSLLVGCLLATRAQVSTWRDDRALFGHALAATGDNYLAHEMLAGALLRAGLEDAAVEHLEASIALEPGWATAQNNLGHVHLGRGDLARAEAAFRAALRGDPAHVDALSNLGVALCMQGRDADGRGFLRRALDLDPGHAGAHTNLATSLRNAGELAAAAEHFARALELEPRHVQAAVGLASLLARPSDAALFDPERAVRTAEHAASLTGEPDPQVLHVLATAYAAAGRRSEALDAAERAVELAERAGAAALAEALRRSLAELRAAPR